MAKDPMHDQVKEARNASRREKRENLMKDKNQLEQSIKITLEKTQ